MQAENQSEMHEKEGEDSQVKRSQFKQYIIKAVIIVVSLANFSLVAYVLATSVNFFSFLFSLASQLTAKAYLEQHYRQIIAVVYVSIFGQVITVVDDIVLFTRFSQKKMLLGIHIFFFLIFFICGIIALVGSPEYLESMNQQPAQCSESNIDCLICSSYLFYREQLVIFFSSFCVSFVLFMVLYHWLAIYEIKHGMILAPQTETDQMVEVESRFSDKNSDFSKK